MRNRVNIIYVLSSFIFVWYVLFYYKSLVYFTFPIILISIFVLNYEKKKYLSFIPFILGLDLLYEYFYYIDYIKYKDIGNCFLKCSPNNWLVQFFVISFIISIVLILVITQLIQNIIKKKKAKKLQHSTTTKPLVK